MKALLLFEHFPTCGFRYFYLAVGLFICYIGFTKLRFDVRINPFPMLVTSLIQLLSVKCFAEY